MLFPIPKILKSSLKTIAPVFITFLIVIAFLFGAFTQLDKAGKIPVALITGLFSFATVNSIFEALVEDEKKAAEKTVREEFENTIDNQEKIFLDSITSIEKDSRFPSEYDILIGAIMKILNPQTTSTKFLSALANRSTKKVLRKEHYTKEEMNKDKKFYFLYRDLYILLRAWLVYSLILKTEMPIENNIPLRYPNPDKPYYETYIRALKLIQDDIYRYEALTSELNDKEQQILLDSFEEYLGKLIDKINKLKIYSKAK